MITYYYQSTNTSQFIPTMSTTMSITNMIIVRTGINSFAYSYNIVIPAQAYLNDPYIIYYEKVEKVNNPLVWFDTYRAWEKPNIPKTRYPHQSMIFKPQTRRSITQRRRQKRKIYLQKL